MKHEIRPGLVTYQRYENAKNQTEASGKLPAPHTMIAGSTCHSSLLTRKTSGRVRSNSELYTVNNTSHMVL